MATPVPARRHVSRAQRRWSQLRAGALDTFFTGATAVVYVFLLAPIVVVIVYSFDRSSTGFIWTGFSTTWYRTLFHDAAIWQALRVSLVVGVTAAACATALGTMSAYAMARRKFRGRAVFNALLLMPLVVPEIVLAVAFLVFLVRVGAPLGYFSLICGHILVVLPFSTLIMMAATSGLHRDLEEAASDLGANPRQVVIRIILPLLFPAMFASFVLAFLFSFDDIVMSTFVNGVGTTTLPLLVYSMLKLGVSPEVNALGTLLVAVTLVLLLTTGVRQATVMLKRG